MSEKKMGMSTRFARSVSATAVGKPTRVTAWERQAGPQLSFARITDEPTLTVAEARELAHCLYVLASRLEKRLVEKSDAPDAQTPPLPEGRDEAREEGQATPSADVGAHGLRVYEAPRLAER